MTRLKKLALVAVVAIALAAGSLADAAPAAPRTLASFSWGATQRMGFIEDEEVLEVPAGSKGDIVSSAV